MCSGTTCWVCLGTRRKVMQAVFPLGTQIKGKRQKMLHFTLGVIWLTLIVKFLSFHIDLVKTCSVFLSAEHTTLSDDFIISFIIILGWNINKSRYPLGGMWMMSNCVFFGYLHMQKHRYSNVITYYLWTHASTRDRKLAWSHAQTLSYAHEQTTIQRTVLRSAM